MKATHYLIKKGKYYEIAKHTWFSNDHIEIFYYPVNHLEVKQFDELSNRIQSILIQNQKIKKLSYVSPMHAPEQLPHDLHTINDLDCKISVLGDEEIDNLMEILKVYLV